MPENVVARTLVAPRRGVQAASGLGIILALVVGGAFRFLGLRDQILGGDELHAVRAALSQSLGQILTTYQLTDSCIPLTALDRLLIDHGLTLSELRLRLPSLLAGLLVPPLFALLLRSRLPGRVVRIWLWLLSVSPLLVLYSRIARSYLPMVALSGAAIWVFERWWNGEKNPRTKWWGAVLYGSLGSLAVWFHLGAAPIVGAPLLYAAADLALSRGASRGTPAARTGQSVAALLAALGTLAAGCAVLILPAFSSLLEVAAAKHQTQSIPIATWLAVLHLQAGSAAAGTTTLFGLLTVLGLARLWRGARRLAAFTLTLVAVQLLGILVLSPIGLANAVVLDRYLLPLLPVVLLWVASAWTPRLAATRGEQALLALAAAVVVATFVIAGPFADPDQRGSSFQASNAFVDFAHPRSVLRAEAFSSPYRRIGGGPVVETPWPPTWDFGRALSADQEIHGLRVLVAPPPGALEDVQLRFRNELSSTPEALLGSPARWVIVHGDLGGEEDALRENLGRPMPRPMRRAFVAAAQRLAASLTARWGPPDVRDATTEVEAWDLRRVRNGGGITKAAMPTAASADNSNPTTKPRGR
jgi:hypothetical protein